LQHLPYFVFFIFAIPAGVRHFPIVGFDLHFPHD
jgi:hypothetical protein